MQVSPTQPAGPHAAPRKSGAVSLPPGAPSWLLAVICVFALILVFTRPNDYVDTFNYAKNIVDHSRHELSPEADPFWDFGHPLLRPMGAGLLKTLHVFRISLLGRGDLFDAAAALILISITASFAAVILIYLLALRVCSNPKAAALVALGFGATDAVVNYAQTGTAYMFGLAGQLMALYLILRSIDSRRYTRTRAAVIAVPLTLSICIWFPDILPMGGLLAFALLWTGSEAGQDWRRRISFVLAIVIGTGLLTGLVYGVVIANGHIRGIHGFLSWVTRSRYGITTDRGLLRMIGGIPRGFFWLGSGSTVWKQALFHADGTRVTLSDLLRSGIWKVAAVYGVLFVAGWDLCRSLRGRRLLTAILVAALPVLYFAAFLFDPGPPERYLGVFPLLFLGFAVLLSERRNLASHIVLPVFFLAMLTVNAAGMFRFGGDRALQPVIARLQAINASVGPQDQILVLAPTEAIPRFLENRPFDPASRNRFLFTPLVHWGSSDALGWKTNAAKLILSAWSSGGRVWLTRQALAPAPQLEWNWVEGDDRRMRWDEIPAFFAPLELGQPFGGPEGFVEILPSPKNHEFFEHFANH